MKTFKVKEKCKSCQGTGIYKGMAERDNIGVVCHKCKGSGCFDFTHEYEPFDKRKISDVKRVLETNPGIVVGTNAGHKVDDFGGMSYKDWSNGNPFPDKSEMRQFTCPVWWYQSANYKLKPDWNECGRGTFSQCEHFATKSKCWERFDKENQK